MRRSRKNQESPPWVSAYREVPSLRESSSIGRRTPSETPQACQECSSQGSNAASQRDREFCAMAILRRART
eukprot:5162361-Pyramimonas_sp.AAC.1